MNIIKSKLTLTTIFLLLSSSIINCSEVELIIIDKDDNREIRIVDSEITEFTIYRDYTKTVLGLDKLTKLTKISIIAPPYIEKDLAFLNNLKYIEVLIIHRVTIEDTTFLSNWQNLKELVLQSVKYTTSELNLINASKLEYLEISNSYLVNLPKIIGSFDNLYQVNLAYNKINLNGLDNNISLLEKSGSVILTKNPILSEIKSEKLNKINILEGDLFDVLDKKYFKYIR